MAIVAGIDVGTQSTKVVCYDTQTKTILASASAPHELISRGDGSREQEAVWWTDAITACFNEIDPKMMEKVEAIGVSGQQHGFVPIDSDGNVLHTVKLWNDTSTAAECDALTKCAGGEESLLDNYGNLILPGYNDSKILWFKNNHPEKYAKDGPYSSRL